MPKPIDILKSLHYSFTLPDMSNKELLTECFNKVYGETRFDCKGAVIDEMISRLDNEDDIMKEELVRGIL